MTWDVIICSPPFAETDTKPTKLGSGKGTRCGKSADRNKGDYIYGDSPGQLGSMKLGSFKEDNMKQETSRESVVSTWERCYEDSWRGIIVDDAFTH